MAYNTEDENLLDAVLACNAVYSKHLLMQTLFFLLHYTVSPKKEATKPLAIRKIFILFFSSQRILKIG